MEDRDLNYEKRIAEEFLIKFEPLFVKLGEKSCFAAEFSLAIMVCGYCKSFIDENGLQIPPETIYRKFIEVSSEMLNLLKQSDQNS